MGETTETSQRARSLPHPDWMERFLEALREEPVVRSACRKAGVSYPTAYRHRNADPEFATKWMEALKEGDESIIQEMFRRGVHGYRVPVIYKGKIQGVWVSDAGEIVDEGTEGATLQPLTVKHYSDACLLKLAEGHYQDIYGRRLTVKQEEGSVDQEIMALTQQLEDQIKAGNGHGEPVDHDG